MNVYQPYQYHALTDLPSSPVRLTVDDETSPVGTELTALIGAAPAVAAWTYQSPPVAAHNHPYYLVSQPVAVRSS